MTDVIQDSLDVYTDTSGVTHVKMNVRCAAGSVACSPLTVAVRDYSGGSHDFTGTNVTLTTAEYEYTASQTLAAGNYYMWGTYYYTPQATWYNLFRQPLVVPSVYTHPGTRLGKSNAFFDDFTTPPIDTTKWAINNTSSYPSNGPDNPGDHKVDYFHTGNVVSSGGRAVFTAEDAGFTISGFPQGGSLEAWYTAFLSTENVTSGFQVQTGDYLEARVKLPGGKGSDSDAAGAWPALWTWKSGNGEVDVFEYHPDNPNLLEFGNHLGVGSSYYYTNAQDIYPGAWVTIGALMGSTAVTWYVNGSSVHADTVGVGSGFSSYINLNLSLSDGFYHPQPSGAPFTFEADYVGVWR